MWKGGPLCLVVMEQAHPAVDKDGAVWAVPMPPVRAVIAFVRNADDKHRM